MRLPTRLSTAAAGAGVIGLLMPAGALGAPIPSPSLDGLLAPPPAGYTAVPAAQFHGHFTATEYASSYKVTAQAAEGALRRDGFVDGYGLTWVERSTGHVLLEFVIALKGGGGARDWMAYEKASDLSHVEYKHADTVAGIDPYYGVHEVSVTPSFVLDAFSFVKGNDMFGVGFVSQKDDVLTLTTAQVLLQHDSAPTETIPSAQWPENTQPPQDAGIPLNAIAVIALIVIVVGGGAVVFTLRRPRTNPLLLAVPAPATVPLPSAPTINQMTRDGNQWWDGRRWVESSQEAPPFAQRTNDGAYWWDGFNWRAVPAVGSAAN